MSLRGVLPSPPRGEKQQSGWEGREGGREEGQALPETGGEEDGHGASAPFPELPLLSLECSIMALSRGAWPCKPNLWKHKACELPDGRTVICGSSALGTHRSWSSSSG